MYNLRSKILCCPILIGALILAGCDDEELPVTPTPDQGTQVKDTTVSDPEDSSTQEGPCRCKANEVCDIQERCIPWPATQPGEAFAEFTLIAMHTLMESSIIANVGMGEARIYPHDPLPSDSRETFTTLSGESCWKETGTMWPDYMGDGSYWPESVGLNAGNITFQVSGAPSPIILEAIYRDEVFGWGYNHVDVPIYIEDETTVYMDYFDLANVPAGAAFEVQTEGGDDVAATTITGGILPDDFTVTEPDVETGVPSVVLTRDVTVSWSPPQTGAFMEIWINQTIGDAAFSGLIRCRVADDGEAIIPASGLVGFSPERVQLQLRRHVVVNKEIQTEAGDPLHVFVVGRNMRLGYFMGTAE